MTLALWVLILAAAVYVVSLIMLRRRGASVLGFTAEKYLIVWRTTRGNALLARAGRARGWGGVGDMALALTLVFALATLLLLVARAARAVLEPPGMWMPQTGPRGLLAIPGVNPAVPLLAGGAALVLAILVHEAGHGVMAYANGLRLKSAGVLFAVLPIGAFVEPEDEDMRAASRRAKLRVIAAGPAANLALAAVALVLLQALVLPSIGTTQTPGVGISSVETGSAASAADLRPGDILLSIEGVHTASGEEVRQALAGTATGETISLSYARGGSVLATQATVTEGGRLGIEIIDLRFQHRVLDVLRDPLQGGLGSFEVGTRSTPPGSFTLFLTIPMATLAIGDDPLTGEAARFLTPSGALGWLPLSALAGAAAFLYWLAWINLTMAAFNVLPIHPLDGGQALRELLRPATQSDPATPSPARERAVRIATNLTLVLLLVPLVAGRAWGFLT